jgi:hypothetical protein
MDISPEELQHLRNIAQNVTAGKKVQEVTISYLEEGEEKTITITDPLLLYCFQQAAMEVHRKRNLEQ